MATNEAVATEMVQATSSPENKEENKEQSEVIQRDPTLIARDPSPMFSSKTIHCTRKLFEGIMIWFSILLFSWDIVVPIACIRVATWQPKEAAYCDTTKATPPSGTACLSCPTNTCMNSDRPYGDTPLWWGTQMRQEFGVYWIVFITIHVLMAWMVFPTLAFQLFCTIHGSKVHKICGITGLIFVTVLWSFGGVAAAILLAERGLHPCSMKLFDYNPDVPSWKQSAASSFPFFLYLQYAYDGANLNECIIHGIAARLLIGVCYDYQVKNPRDIIKKWHGVVMIFLSASSLWLYVWRTITMLAITFYVIGSFDSSATTDTGNQTMCISSKKLLDPGAPDLIDCLTMSALFIAQTFLLPFIQITNLRFGHWVYGYAADPSLELIPWQLVISHHGGNLTVVVFVVLWTFIANVGFVFNDNLIGASYVIGALALMTLYFCKCQIVQPCPFPYNYCCVVCCSPCEKAGCHACQNSCRCCIPNPEDQTILKEYTQYFYHEYEGECCKCVCCSSG